MIMPAPRQKKNPYLRRKPELAPKSRARHVTGTLWERGCTKITNYKDCAGQIWFQVKFDVTYTVGWFSIIFLCLLALRDKGNWEST